MRLSFSRVLLLLGLLPSLAFNLAQAQQPAVLRDPRTAVMRQPFDLSQRAELQGMLQDIQQRPAYHHLLGDTPPLGLNDVLLSFTAPFRRAEAERLDVVRAGKAVLLLWNGGREAWSMTTSLQLAETCLPTLAYTLRDINGDGLREVEVQLACGDNVLQQNVILLLDFSQVYPRALGVLPLEEAALGLDEQRHARILEVYKGQPTRFQGQELEFMGRKNGQPTYRLTGRVLPLKLQQSWPLVARQLW